MSSAYPKDEAHKRRRTIDIEDAEPDAKDGAEDAAAELEAQEVEAEIVDEAEGAGADAGTAPDSEDTAETAESDEDATAALEAELADAKDKYVRLQAEWDNYRKRTAAERAEERSRATEKLIGNLLPVVDDMERAIDSASAGADSDPMLDGIKAIYAKLTDVLVREGLEAINPEDGEAFDIHQHQAVSNVEDSSVPDESVRQVYQKGYKMGEKLLRPAMVVVTTGGPKRKEQQ